MTCCIFFSPQRTKQSLKLWCSQQVSPVWSYLSHSMVSDIWKKLFGNSRKQNAAEIKVADRVQLKGKILFGVYFENLYLGTFENKMFKNLWLGLEADEWICNLRVFLFLLFLSPWRIKEEWGKGEHSSQFWWSTRHSTSSLNLGDFIPSFWKVTWYLLTAPFSISLQLLEQQFVFSGGDSM